MADDVSEATGEGPVTVDHLIALNDEIVALARAGVPMERGLIDIGSDLPGRLSRIAKSLGERMTRGESLADALAATGKGVPKVYRAVVEAGLRSGRLSMALEGLSTYARGYTDARRSIGLALWYPLLVLVIAYVMFLSLVTNLVPRLVSAFNYLQLPTTGPLNWLSLAGDRVWIWGPILPVLLAIFFVGWIMSRRTFSLAGGRPGSVLKWFPWMGSLMKGYEAASYADLLALLVEHRVPYPEALMLAGEASGDAALAKSSKDLASAIEKGLPPAEALAGRSAFPPLLRWMLATGPRQDDLVASLRMMAHRYRSRARFQAEKIRIFLPMILLFGIGATATLFYALALFLPLASLWTNLARPLR